jgi:hypothetical protein
MKPLIQALARASMNFTGIKKDGHALAGGTRPYNYMTLDEILAAVRPALAAEGLFLWHDPKIIENRLLEVHCHVSDGEHTLSNHVPMPMTFSEKANAAQAMGSLLTYGKRYSICALLGISADVDDDAQATAPETKPAAPMGPRIVPAAPAPEVKRSGGSASPVAAPDVPPIDHEMQERMAAIVDEQQQKKRKELLDKFIERVKVLGMNKNEVLLEKFGMTGTMIVEKATLAELKKWYDQLPNPKETQ